MTKSLLALNEGNFKEGFQGLNYNLQGQITCMWKTILTLLENINIL